MRCKLDKTDASFSITVLFFLRKKRENEGVFSSMQQMRSKLRNQVKRGAELVKIKGQLQWMICKAKFKSNYWYSAK